MRRSGVRFPKAAPTPRLTRSGLSSLGGRSDRVRAGVDQRIPDQPVNLPVANRYRFGPGAGHSLDHYPVVQEPVTRLESRLRGPVAVVDAVDEPDDRGEPLRDLECVAVQAELSSSEAARPLIDAAVQHFGKVDILVGNHGVWRLESGHQQVLHRLH